MALPFALLSVVFTTCFVVVLDRVQIAAGCTRFCKKRLLNQQEIDQLRSILSACQED